LQTWQPQVIFVSDWSISEKIFSSQTASQIKMKLGRQHHAAYQDSLIWGSGFRREGLCRNQPIRNKNDLQLPFLQTDRDEMSNLYR
jgi:hypothetical protein